MPANGPTRSAAPGSGGSLGIWVALHRLRRRRPPQTPSGVDAATLPAELAVVSTGSTGLDKLSLSKHDPPPYDTNGFEPVPSATIRSSTSGEVVFSPSRFGLPAP